MNKTIFFIVGPTGVGKSDVAVQMAQKLDGEIVSADSMQMYRGMDIGTAKLTPSQQSGIPHHLLDIVDVTTPMDVSMYRDKAFKAIEEIFSRKKMPFVVGGSGLYVRSLTDGLFEGPACNPKLRQELTVLAEKKGKGALHEALKKVDPEAAQRINSNDQRRLIRALEVYAAEKKPLSQHQAQWNKRFRSKTQEIPQGYPFRLFGLTLDRKVLYQRLNKRVEKMFEQGLVDETQRLIGLGLKKNQVALQAIGYKEVVLYLEGKIPLEEAKAEVKKATRQFAKRQLTWFRRDPRVEWVELSANETIEEIASILYNIVRK